MQDKIKILFSLLRSAIRGELLSEEEKSSYTEEMLSQLIPIAKSHDLLHLVAYALDINKLDGKDSIANSLMQAIYRYEQLNYTLKQLCESLEIAHIPFMPLKGSVVRKYYREPWLRTSCDVDILVHTDDAETAANYLVDSCGYSREGKGSHDISLFSQSKNHVELHYDLVEAGLINRSTEVLRSVWEASTPNELNKFCFEMPNEMFYFYHIAHMAKHFVHGGCGIRPFIDLWILDSVGKKDQNKRNALLAKGDLLKFAEAVSQLSRVWFDKADHTETTKQMEQYILRGGVYGSSKNRIVVQQQIKGGKFKYALSKIFIPYDVIKFHYPILQKHRWLTPIMEVRRWFKLAFCGYAKSSIGELKYNSNISHKEAEDMQLFLNNIGL